MSDPITSVPHKAFVTLIPVHVFTDAEIAEWIDANQPHGKQKLELLEAIVQFKRGPVDDPIRAALRRLEGLPPTPRT